MSWTDFLAWCSAVGAWLQTVPAVIVGVLIGSGISYISTVSTNRGGDRRLRKQLDAESLRLDKQLTGESERLGKRLTHEAEESRLKLAHDAIQKNEDRKAAIRREVYLGAVEKAHALLAHLGALLGKDGLQRQVPFQEFLQANAKIALVAELEAAHLSRELANLVGEWYFKALPKAVHFEQLLVPHKAREVLMAATVAERDRASSEWRRAREIPETPQERLDALMGTHDHASGLVYQLTQEQAEYAPTLQQARVDYARSLFDDMAAVQRTLVKLNSALRKELHLEPDEEGFMAQLQDMERRARTALGMLVPELAQATPTSRASASP